MKHIISILFLFALSFGYGQKDNYDRLSGAFSKGNTTLILKECGEKILMTVHDKEAVYSKQQASMILKKFFLENPPKSFKYSYRGPIKNGAAFGVGEYLTEKATFRITTHLKKVGNAFRVEQLSIDRK